MTARFRLLRGLGAAAALALFAFPLRAEDAGPLPASHAGARPVADDPAAGRPLSDADVGRYKRIFALQEKGDWSAANKQIVALENDVLLGYVRFQRYMHPTAYRSTYKELSDWLKHYADHPDANRIYKLAVKRRPSGASAPKKNSYRRWRSPEGHQLHPDLQADYDRSRRRKAEARRIERHVRSLLRRERPTQALNYISSGRHKRALTNRQYDRIRSWIAAAYYHLGYAPKARRIAVQVAARHGDEAVLSYWIAGLSAWKAGDADAAFRHFNAMAKVPYQDDWMRAGAGFWAARAALAAAAPEAVAPNLEIAADYPFTFYGQLALAQLGRERPVDWNAVDLSEGDWRTLAKESPRAARAAALAQLGRTSAAETELRWAHGELSKRHDRALLALARRHDLPAAELFIALQSSPNDAALEAGLYPSPDIAPDGGFDVDKALLFAIIRQESKFHTDTTSRAGAQGLMQLMPRTARYIADKAELSIATDHANLHRPGPNLALGQAYVRYLLDRMPEEDLLQFAVAYNGGPGNLRRWKERTGVEDPLLFIESLPSPETRNYVEHVLTNFWLYRARFDQETPSRDALAAGAAPSYRALDASEAG